MTDTLPFPPAARVTDPATSHQALASMRDHLSAQQALVLAVVRTHPRYGVTAWEVVQVVRESHGMDLQQNVVARRLTDLERADLIEPAPYTRPGRSHRQLRVYLPREAA